MMELAKATALAEQAAANLDPLVERVEVVGSVRRRKPHVNDIELLIEPRMVEVDLFGSKGPDVEPIRGAVSSWGELVKNGDRFIQVEAPEVTFDLFLCHPPAQWGALKVIRTGPAAFSTRCVTALRDHGYLCRGGAVYRARYQGNSMVPGGGPLETPTERDFLELCGVGWIDPEGRV